MKSPIKWVGGKTKEIKYIEKHIPEYFDEYCEHVRMTKLLKFLFVAQ